MRLTRHRILTLLTLLAVISTICFFFTGRKKQYQIVLSAGDPKGYRAHVAEYLVESARMVGLDLRLVPSKGSEDSLELIAQGEIDAALIQGGLDAPPEIQQAAVLIEEPIHFLVRPDLVGGGITSLRGKRVCLGPLGRGTRTVGLEILETAGLRIGDFLDSSETYGELEKKKDEDLPDAIVVVSAIPSTAVERLVQRGFVLMPVPLGDSINFRDRAIHDTEIPAFTYQYSPAVPDKPLHTPSVRQLLVVSESLPDEAVASLLSAIFDSDFRQRANLPPLNPKLTIDHAEFANHSGVNLYLNRDQPFLNGEIIEGIENLRSFIVSGLVAAILLWQYLKRRNSLGFEPYFDRVSQLEREIWSTPINQWNQEFAKKAHDRLTAIKNEALDAFSKGDLTNDTYLQSFLLHISDTRRCLIDLADG